MAKWKKSDIVKYVQGLIDKTGLEEVKEELQKFINEQASIFIGMDEKDVKDIVEDIVSHTEEQVEMRDVPLGDAQTQDSDAIGIARQAEEDRIAEAEVDRSTIGQSDDPYYDNVQTAADVYREEMKKKYDAEIKIYYPFKEEKPGESHAKWFKEFIEQNDPDIKVTIVDDAKDADLVFARKWGDTPPEKLMGNPFSHVKGKNLGVVQTKDFWETKKLYQAWLADELFEGVTADGKTIQPEQFQELDKWASEQQKKIVTPVQNQIDEVDKANLEDMKNAPLGDAQTMDSDAYGIARQAEEDRIAFDEIDQSTIGLADDVIEPEKIKGNIELSSKGDSFGKQYSAIYATFGTGSPYAGRTIEDVWQHTIKNLRPQHIGTPDGTPGSPLNKSKTPDGSGVLQPEKKNADGRFTNSDIEYKKLWAEWAKQNPDKIIELEKKYAEGYRFIDTAGGQWSYSDGKGLQNQADTLTRMIRNESFMNNLYDIAEGKGIETGRVKPEAKVFTDSFFDPKERKITELPENHIFVFGSNEQGIHGAKAAKDAKNFFGAELGVGKGLTGQSYALPTRTRIFDENGKSKFVNLPDSEIEKNIKEFVNFSKSRPDLKFVTTEVGTGLAGGNTPEEKLKSRKKIAKMFKNAGVEGVNNIIIPERFDNEMKGIAPPQNVPKKKVMISANQKNILDRFANLKRSTKGDVTKIAKFLSRPNNHDMLDYLRTVFKEQSIRSLSPDEANLMKGLNTKEFIEVMKRAQDDTDKIAKGKVNLKDTPPAGAKQVISSRGTDLLRELQEWHYNDLEPIRKAEGGKYAGQYELAKDLSVVDGHLDMDNIVNGKAPSSGTEVHQIIRGHQKGFIVDEGVWQNLGFEKKTGVTIPGDNPVKGDISFIGLNATDAKKLPYRAELHDKKTRGGVYVTLIEDPELLKDLWWEDPETFERVRKALGWSPKRLEQLVRTEKRIQVDEFGEKVVGGDTGVKQGAMKRAPSVTSEQKAAKWANARLLIFDGPMEFDSEVFVNKPQKGTYWGIKGPGIPYGHDVAGGGTGQRTPIPGIGGDEVLLGAHNYGPDGSWIPNEKNPGYIDAIESRLGMSADELSNTITKLSKDIFSKAPEKIGTGIGALGYGVSRGLRVMDYGEVAYGWGAEGLAKTISGLNNPQGLVGKMGSKIVPQGITDVGKFASEKIVGRAGKYGMRNTLITAGSKSLAGRVGLRAGQKLPTKSVAVMSKWEHYNFLYALGTGLIAGLLESAGIMIESTWGEDSIRNALGPEFYEWAEGNGVIDRIGPWPILSSLRQAEEEGIIQPGIVDGWIEENNEKWLGALYKFLGTTGYMDMDSVDTVWKNKELPSGWFGGSLNDLMPTGLNVDSGMFEKEWLPTPGFMPAIKRSPIIQAIELPFERWFLPKVGLEDWVIPEDDGSVEAPSPYYEMGNEDPNIFLPPRSSMMDNSGWIGNAMKVEEDG